MGLAVVAISLYPVGLFVLNGGLLGASSEAILSENPTALSRATAFLHREYKPSAFWWELAECELLRCLLLVGAYGRWPLPPGLDDAARTRVAHVRDLPRHSNAGDAIPHAHADNWLAVGCSLSLVVFLLAAIF